MALGGEYIYASCSNNRLINLNFFHCSDVGIAKFEDFSEQFEGPTGILTSSLFLPTIWAVRSMDRRVSEHAMCEKFIKICTVADNFEREKPMIERFFLDLEIKGV